MAERPTDGQRTPRLRRVQHPRRLVAVVLVLAAATTGAFFAGRLTAAPSRDQILAAQQPIPITAKAETRVVDTGEIYAATVRAGSSLKVLAATAGPAVVVRRTVALGSVVGYGALLGVVSGQPYFALPAPLPLYRDLQLNDRGDDVTALQTSLNAAGFALNVTGVVDRGTMASAKALFKSGGFDLASTAPIPYQQLVPIPTASGTATEVAEVGARLDDETPLLSIQVAAPQIVLRADAVTAAGLQVGAAMTVLAAAATFPATIASIGEFGDGTDGAPPGRDVYLASEAPAFAGIAVGSSVSIEPAGKAATISLAVPITALHDDEDRTYVLRETHKDGRQAFERIDVNVLESGGGWAAIEDTGEIRDGDSVRVS
jgi:peptidoglycan hydrolase-like protein with peptidoglycan-binding domain